MDQAIAASNSQTELDTTLDGHLPDDQELAVATHSVDEDALTDDQDSKSEHRLECPHCSKTYTTKKSLTRHLSNARSACAKLHPLQAQRSSSKAKTRWACSRCGKDCATSQSVDRHIERSCWRSCDECAANGVTRCDSGTKVGPCRTCEAKGRPCTKHTSTISGTVPQPWIDPAAQSQQVSTVDEEVILTTQQMLGKRKAPAGPMTTPEEAHKDKRKVPATQPETDYGSGRVYDPLGGQAYVPPVVKKNAVSSWLQGQMKNDGSSATPTPGLTQNNSPVLSQASSAQLHHNIQQYDQLVEPSHIFGRALPRPANAFAFQHAYGNGAPNYQQNLPRLSPPQTYRISGYRPATFPYVSGIKDLPPLGGIPVSKSGGSGQFDHLLRQLQATRQQNAAHELEMAIHFGPRNNTTFPPQCGLSGPLPFSNGHQTNLNNAVLNTPLPRTVIPVGSNKNDSVLTLRIHSNIHDANGQPIFSILRIRRDQAFGPRLDAYCINRGKEYGVDWMFVYRYLAAAYKNPKQERQITLTWDMTPNDLNHTDFPCMTMTNMDTIYVMHARPSASSSTARARNDDFAVQSPGLQVSHSVADIIPGEISVFQNPHVSHQWYRSIEQDATRLRAAHNTMKSSMLQAQQEILAKTNLIMQQKQAISELTYLSAQLRQRMQLGVPPSNSNSAPQVPMAHVVRQRPGQLLHMPVQHITAQWRSNADTSTFMAKCEAARDHQKQTPQRREPLQFASGSDEFARTGFAHQISGDDGLAALVPCQGRVCDAADRIGADSGFEGMDEKMNDEESGHEEPENEEQFKNKE